MLLKRILYNKSILLVRILLVFTLLLSIDLCMIRQSYAQQMQPPKIIASTVSEYPAEARQKGMAGKVILRITIDKDGNVQDVEVYKSSGHDILDETAKEMARKWQFQPARNADGKAVMSRMLAPISFDTKQPTPPKLVYSCKPDYPIVASMLNISGTVELRLMVSAEGHVQEVSIKKSSGYAILDEAAIDAVKQWLFEPAHNGKGEPIEFALNVPINFSLENSQVADSESKKE